MTDTPPLPKPPTTKARINDQGLVELVDLFTGRVVAVQSDPSQTDFLASRFENLVRIETDAGPVFIERGLDASKITKHLSRHHKIAYSQYWADVIASHILDNNGLDESLRKAGVTRVQHVAWKKEHKEYSDIIDEAFTARAEFYHDEALTVARSTKSSDEVAANKLKVAALQWSAERTDPDKFGAKQKVDVDHKGSVSHTIILETGIRRGIATPEGFKDVIRSVDEARARAIPAGPSGGALDGEEKQREEEDGQREERQSSSFQARERAAEVRTETQGIIDDVMQDQPGRTTKNLPRFQGE